MSGLLKAEASLLLVIDVQERLVPAVAEPEAMLGRLDLLLAAARTLDVPRIASEQYPKGLGPLLPAVREAMGDGAVVLPKLAFSAMGEPAIAEALDAALAGGRSRVVVTGVEAHVCVLQTAFELRERGFEPVVVADAVASRRGQDLRLGLDRMRDAGIGVVTAEMVVFEWLGRAGTDAFKTLSRLIR